MIETSRIARISKLGGCVFVLIATYYVVQSIWTRQWLRMQMRRRGCEAPPAYPHIESVLGLDFFMEGIRNSKNSRALEGWYIGYQKYGTTFSATLMGRKAICTVNPSNLQALHATDFNSYGLQPIRRIPTLPFLGDGIFNSDGLFWEHSRALLRPTFTRVNVANLPAFEVHFKRFLELIPQDGSTVDLKPLLMRLFLDSSTEFLFGESLDTLSPKNPARTEEFLRAFHYGMRGVGIRIQLGKLMFLYRDKKWKESIKVAHDFADRYVEKALEFRQHFLEGKLKSALRGDALDEDGETGQYVLLNEMAKETNHREELRHQILHVFLAGHDSSPITITNAIFRLCRNPEMWEKLRSEVLDGDQVLTFENLKPRRYLQYVIKETLRLHPVAPTDTRIASKDTVLPSGGGVQGTAPIFVPKGTLIVTSYHAEHLLAECFQPDADAFRPERWETVRPGWSYLPFGGGPRRCPGQNLALTEVAYVLARMAQVWERLECRDDVAEWIEDLKLTASSRNGAKVGLFPAQ